MMIHCFKNQRCGNPALCLTFGSCVAFAKDSARIPFTYTPAAYRDAGRLDPGELQIALASEDCE